MEMIFATSALFLLNLFQICRSGSCQLSQRGSMASGHKYETWTFYVFGVKDKWEPIGVTTDSDSDLS